MYPMRVNIHGRIFEMGRCHGGCHLPLEYAGMGLMHELMTRSLQEMRSRGQTISFFISLFHPFYRKKGWRDRIR
ncbi:MAG: GNAT family N-acetyltransferase [Clostridia bacterium]